MEFPHSAIDYIGRNNILACSLVLLMFASFGQMVMMRIYVSTNEDVISYACHAKVLCKMVYQQYPISGTFSGLEEQGLVAVTMWSGL